MDLLFWDRFFIQFEVVMIDLLTWDCFLISLEIAIIDLLFWDCFFMSFEVAIIDLLYCDCFLIPFEVAIVDLLFWDLFFISVDIAIRHLLLYFNRISFSNFQHLNSLTWTILKQTIDSSPLKFVDMLVFVLFIHLFIVNHQIWIISHCYIGLFLFLNKH